MIGVNKDTIACRYAELEHYGFLRKTTGAHLGLDGRGVAPHYRFTDLMYGTHPTTRDYEQWDGELFDRKKQNPVRRRRTPRLTASDIRKVAGGGSVCPTASDIDNPQRCPTASDISRLPVGEGMKEGMQAQDRLQGSLTVRAPVQAGRVGSSPTPVTNPTEMVLEMMAKLSPEVRMLALGLRP